MQFTCPNPNCRQPCCSCSGCQAAVSTKGMQCCTRCVLGVNRMETSAEQLQRVEDILQQNRPNERLYINGI